MSDTDFILTKVREAFKSALEIDPQLVSMETNADGVSGWDSFGHLSLAAALEEDFGISFDVDELMAMENVRGIVSIIAGKLSKKV